MEDASSMIRYVLSFACVVSLAGCLTKPGTAELDDSIAGAVPTFANTHAVLDKYCGSCHQTGSPQGSFESYSALMDTGYIVAGDPDASKLCTVAKADPEPLPPDLPPDVSANICAWITAGALDD